MPIKDLTTPKALADTKRGIPIVGDFRKGEEKDDKGRWGKDLEDGSWRVTFREGYEMFEQTFHALFSDTREPFIIATIDETPDEVFNDFNRLYGSNGLAQIVCDGEQIQFSADNKVTQCMDCKAKREAAKTAKEKAQYCTPNAYFRFTIPRFNKALQMPVPFLFQFNVTSQTELQHIKKELKIAHDAKGTLVNELFLLYRNNRRFNRGGMANDKSLAYTLWLDRNLEEKADAAQLRLDTGEIETPQLPHGDTVDSAIPAEELNQDSQAVQLSEREQLIIDVPEWVEKRFDMDMEAFLFQMGSFLTVEELVDAFKDRETLENQIIQEMCIKRKLMVKIYGCRTMPYNKSVRMAIPFGFGMIFSYSRKDFGEWEDVARRGYGEAVDGKYPHNIATPGDHAFAQAFALPFLSMELGLTDTGNLKIVRITGDIPF